LKRARDYRLLVFDWDGTLVDSVNRILTCFQRTFARHALPSPDSHAVRGSIGLPLAEAFRHLAPDEDAAILTETYKHVWWDESLPMPEPFQGVPELLAELHGRGFTLAVATGKSRAGLDREVLRFGVDHFFSATRCGDETAAKPDPDMLLQIMGDCGFSSADTLMIGDTGLDLEMARRAEVHAVGVLSGGHDETHLAPFEPAVCLPDVLSLTAFLDG